MMTKETCPAELPIRRSLVKTLILRLTILILIGSTTYYVYGIYLKTHEVILHNNVPSLGKEESNYDFVSMLKGERNGTYRTYYPNGQLREEFTIVKGRKNGPSKTYFDNGALRSEDNYKNDQLDGEIKRYEYATGFFFSVNQYKDGLLDGVNKWYYPTGELRSEELYAKGYKHGPTRFYTEEGRLTQIKNYAGNEQTGLTKYYNEDGTVSSEINYTNGKKDGLATWYYDNGKVSNASHYKTGKMDGLSQIYYYSGQLSDEKNYQDDQLHGPYKYYYPTGKMGAETEYFSGKILGPYKEYYRNGQPKSVKSYTNGQLHGPYTLYLENGDTLLDLVMDNGYIKQIFTDKILVDNTLDDIIQWNDGPHFGSIVRFLLHSKQYDKLEHLSELINSTPESQRSVLNSFIQGIAGYFGAVSIERTPEMYFALLDEWKNIYPNSLAQSLSRIKAMTSLAWNYRGSNYASATTTASFERFNETLLKAERLCKEANNSGEKNPELFARWIWVSIGLNHPNPVTQHIFDQGIAVDKLYFDLYQDRLVSLLPRWGGTKKSVEEFIRQSTSSLPDSEGKELYALLVNTLVQYEGRDFLLKFDLDHNQLLESYYFFVSKHTDNKLLKNRYAWLTSQLQDRERAFVAFQLIDEDDFDNDVWNYDDYRAAYQWASSTDSKPIVSDIHNAVNKNDKVNLYLFLKNNGDINAADSNGQTLLLTALNARHPDLAEYLIKAGADINKTNDYKEAPLHVAANWGYTSIVRQLIEHKALVNPLTKSRLTPLHKAALGGYKEIGRMLIKADRSILNQKTKTGRTALLAACENAQTDFVKMLMDYEEINLSEADTDGYNCMHLAVYKNAKDLINLLLSTQADFLQQKNSRGETALDLAVKANYQDIIQLLKEHTSDVPAVE